MSKKAIGVIPARLGSTRLKEKVLQLIAGKPLIQHVWERVKQCRTLDDVLIACDDAKILEAAKGFGAKAVLTAKDHPSGTDRVAEAVRDLDVDIVVNIQGDEPLISPDTIDALVEVLRKDPSIPMATLRAVIKRDDELDNPNVVKVVADLKGDAFYFSRTKLPFDRDNQGTTYYKHLGVYAYTKEFLLTFTKLPKSKLEQIEQLEQLRALEAGYKIRTIITDQETVGVDTPEDLLKVEQLLRK